MPGDRINLRVFVRVRPFIAEDGEEHGDCAVAVDGRDGVRLQGEKELRCFDAVLGPDVPQVTVFEQVGRHGVNHVIQGYHTTLFLYGQTGSGKTYTAGNGCSSPEITATSGMVPRCIAAVFQRISEDPSHEYRVSLEWIQLYNDTVHDLLGPEGSKELSAPCQIRECPDNGVFLVGAKSVTLSGPQEFPKVALGAEKGRVTALTRMNAKSSRSHSCLMVTVAQRRKMTIRDHIAGGGQAPRHILSGRLCIVDLAGSERLKKSGSEGVRRIEARAINTSLAALGNVLQALTDKTQRHIPYRDSKLTRLLQDSLGGTGIATFVVCLAPSARHLFESKNTLTFAERAREVRNAPVIHRELDIHAKNAELQAAYEGKLVILEGLNRRLEAELRDTQARLQGNDSDSSDSEEGPTVKTTKLHTLYALLSQREGDVGELRAKNLELSQRVRDVEVLEAELMERNVHDVETEEKMWVIQGQLLALASVPVSGLQMLEMAENEGRNEIISSFLGASLIASSHFGHSILQHSQRLSRQTLRSSQRLGVVETECAREHSQRLAIEDDFSVLQHRFLEVAAERSVSDVCARVSLSEMQARQRIIMNESTEWAVVVSRLSSFRSSLQEDGLRNRDETNKWKQQATSSAEEVQTLKQRLCALASELDHATKQRNYEHRSTEEEHEMTKNVIQQLRDTHANATQEAAVLRDDMSRLRAVHAESDEGLRAAELRCESIRNEAGLIESALRAECSALEVLVESLRTEASELQIQLTQTHAQLSSHDSELQSALLLLAETESQLNASHDASEDLRLQNSSLLASNTSLQRDLTIAYTTIDDEHYIKQNFAQNEETLHRQIHCSDESAERAVLEGLKWKGMAAFFSVKVEDSEEAQRHEVGLLHSELDNAKNELREKEERLQQALEELAVSQGETATMETELAVSTEAVRQSQGKLQVKSGEMQQLREELTSVEHQLADMTHQHTALQQETAAKLLQVQPRLQEFSEHLAQSTEKAEVLSYEKALAEEKLSATTVSLNDVQFRVHALWEEVCPGLDTPVGVEDALGQIKAVLGGVQEDHICALEALSDAEEDVAAVVVQVVGEVVGDGFHGMLQVLQGHVAGVVGELAGLQVQHSEAVSCVEGLKTELHDVQQLVVSLKARLSAAALAEEGVRRVGVAVEVDMGSDVAAVVAAVDSLRERCVAQDERIADLQGAASEQLAAASREHTRMEQAKLSEEEQTASLWELLFASHSARFVQDEEAGRMCVVVDEKDARAAIMHAAFVCKSDALIVSRRVTEQHHTTIQSTETHLQYLAPALGFEWDGECAVSVIRDATHAAQVLREQLSIRDGELQELTAACGCAEAAVSRAQEELERGKQEMGLTEAELRTTVQELQDALQQQSRDASDRGAVLEEAAHTLRDQLLVAQTTASEATALAEEEVKALEDALPNAFGSVLQCLNPGSDMTVQHGLTDVCEQASALRSAYDSAVADLFNQDCSMCVQDESCGRVLLEKEETEKVVQIMGLLQKDKVTILQQHCTAQTTTIAELQGAASEQLAAASREYTRMEKAKLSEEEQTASLWELLFASHSARFVQDEEAGRMCVVVDEKDARAAIMHAAFVCKSDALIVSRRVTEQHHTTIQSTETHLQYLAPALGFEWDGECAVSVIRDATHAAQVLREQLSIRDGELQELTAACGCAEAAVSRAQEELERFKQEMGLTEAELRTTVQELQDALQQQSRDASDRGAVLEEAAHTLRDQLLVAQTTASEATALAEEEVKALEDALPNAFGSVLQCLNPGSDMTVQHGLTDVCEQASALRSAYDSAVTDLFNQDCSMCAQDESCGRVLLEKEETEKVVQIMGLLQKDKVTILQQHCTAQTTTIAELQGAASEQLAAASREHTRMEQAKLSEEEQTASLWDLLFASHSARFVQDEEAGRMCVVVDEKDARAAIMHAAFVCKSDALIVSRRVTEQHHTTIQSTETHLQYLAPALGFEWDGECAVSVIRDATHAAQVLREQLSIRDGEVQQLTVACSSAEAAVSRAQEEARVVARELKDMSASCEHQMRLAAAAKMEAGRLQERSDSLAAEVGRRSTQGDVALQQRSADEAASSALAAQCHELQTELDTSRSALHTALAQQQTYAAALRSAIDCTDVSSGDDLVAKAEQHAALTKRTISHAHTARHILTSVFSNEGCTTQLQDPELSTEWDALLERIAAEITQREASTAQFADKCVALETRLTSHSHKLLAARETTARTLLSQQASTTLTMLYTTHNTATHLLTEETTARTALQHAWERTLFHNTTLLTKATHATAITHNTTLHTRLQEQGVALHSSIEENTKLAAQIAQMTLNRAALRRGTERCTSYARERAQHAQALEATLLHLTSQPRLDATTISTQTPHDTTPLRLSLQELPSDIHATPLHFDSTTQHGEPLTTAQAYTSTTPPPPCTPMSSPEAHPLDATFPFESDVAVAHSASSHSQRCVSCRICGEDVKKRGRSDEGRGRATSSAELWEYAEERRRELQQCVTRLSSPDVAPSVAGSVTPGATPYVTPPRSRSQPAWPSTKVRKPAYASPSPGGGGVGSVVVKAERSSSSSVERRSRRTSARKGVPVVGKAFSPY